jgi:predicted XRE-type DNA-binding protein
MKTNEYNISMSQIMETIRTALKESPVKQSRIADETPFSKSELSLFSRGLRGMGLDRLEILAEYLGLEITIRPKKGAK